MATKTSARALAIRQHLERLMEDVKGVSLNEKIDNSNADEDEKSKLHGIRKWCNEHIHEPAGNENATATEHEDFLRYKRKYKNH